MDESNPLLVMLKVLHRSLMGFGGASGFEGTEVAAFAGFDVLLSRVEPVFTGLHLADHCGPPTARRSSGIVNSVLIIAGIAEE